MTVVTLRVHLLPQPGKQADQLPAWPPAQTIRMSSGRSKACFHVVSSAGLDVARAGGRRA